MNDLKAFASVAWKNCKTFDTSRIDWASKCQEFSRWFPVMWRKAENLQRLLFTTEPWSHGENQKQKRKQLFLELINAQFQFSRKIKQLSFSRELTIEVSEAQLIPLLINEWSPTLQSVELLGCWSDDDCPMMDNANYQELEGLILQLIALALKKCEKLQTISIYDCDARPLLWESLMDKVYLKEIDLNSGMEEFSLSDENILALARSLHRIPIEQTKCDVQSKGFHISFVYPASLFSLTKSAVSTNLQLTLITELTIRHADYLDDIEDIRNCWLTSYRSLPSLLSVELQGRLPKVANFPEVYFEDILYSSTAFLEVYGNTRAAEKRTLDMKLAMNDTQPKYREGAWLKLSKDIIASAKQIGGVAAELITDVSQVSNESSSLLYHMSLNLLKGSCSCSIRCQ